MLLFAYVDADAAYMVFTKSAIINFSFQKGNLIKFPINYKFIICLSFVKYNVSGNSSSIEFSNSVVNEIAPL